MLLVEEKHILVIFLMLCPQKFHIIMVESSECNPKGTVWTFTFHQMVKKMSMCMSRPDKLVCDGLKMSFGVRPAEEKWNLGLQLQDLSISPENGFQLSNFKIHEFIVTGLLSLPPSFLLHGLPLSILELPPCGQTNSRAPQGFPAEASCGGFH